MAGSCWTHAASRSSTRVWAIASAVSLSGAVIRISMRPMAAGSDVGAMEVVVRAAGGRSALALIVRAVLLGAVRVVSRGGEPEERELTDLHAGPEHDRQGGDVGELESDVAAETGVDEAGRRVGEQPEPAKAGLALDPSRQVIREGDHLEGAREDELAGVENKSLVRVYLYETGEVGLVLGRVDVGVLVVVEEPEVLVQAHIDAARLDHRRVPGVEDDPAVVDLGADIAVGEKHVVRVSVRQPDAWVRLPTPSVQGRYAGVAQ